jgi:hypothetical protein
VFPCPIDLFEYIADITVLYKLQPNTSMGTSGWADTVQRATILGRGVSAWSSSTVYSSHTSHVVGAWHKGILLYVMRLFYLPHDKTFDEESLKSDIFQHANAVPPATRWGFSMLWPLFQAGLCLTDDHDQERRWLVQRLDTMLRAVGCRQFDIALSTLQVVWAKRDAYYNSITAGDLMGPLMLA